MVLIYLNWSMVILLQPITVRMEAAMRTAMSSSSMLTQWLNAYCYIIVIYADSMTQCVLLYHRHLCWLNANCYVIIICSVHTSALLRCCWSPSNSTEPAPDQSWQYSASQLQNKKQSLVERAVSQVMWPGSLSNPISETVGSPVPEKSALSEI